MADIPDPPSPRQSESACTYFRQTTRNGSTRRRDRSEDNEVEEDEASVIGTNLFKKKKSLVSDGKLHFSTAPTKTLMASVGETERDQTLFQFESSSEIQVQNDSRATATLETETEFTRDARATRERVLKQADMALKGKNKIGGDDELYRGINAYVDHKAGFRREQTIAGEKAGGSHGPLRASAHIRVSTRFDYQPDICKDYKETGYCGYGDSCKFMHDRGDYKSGWQLEKEWDDKEKVKKRKLALKQPGIQEDAEQSDEDDDSLPFECSICRQAFRNPVVTSCKHYFCEHCALKHHTKAAAPLVEPLQYPIARRDDTVVDNYHGVLVPDPYRWLEDPDAEEVKDFVQKQVNLTESVLKQCETREKLQKKLTEFYDYPKYDAPFREGDKFFYFHNTGLQPQKVLYMQDRLDGQPEILLDLNELSEDGTVALSAYAVSKDAKYLAYALSSSGSDWVTIKIMGVQDKKVHQDTLSWVKFSDINWTHDSKGFFYCRFPAPKEGEKVDAGTETNANLDHQMFYHFMGTDQSEDILCWEDPANPKHTFGAQVTDDGKYVLLYTFESTDPVNKLYYCDISAFPNGLEGYKGKSLLPFVKLVDNFDAYYGAIANDDTLFTFRTNKDAPRYKLVRVDLKQPTTWTDVLDEAEKDVLESAIAVNRNQIIVSYMSDVKDVLQLRDLKSGTLLHQLPIDIGTVYDVSARREDSMVFISFTSFLSPGIIYQCNLESGAPDIKIFREIVVPGFSRTEFHVNQVFVSSKDGVRIPIFIVAKKDIPLDGSHPCLLYAYGGFDISIKPSFSVSRIVLMRNLGAIYCVANIRGGGEYGEEWHKAGRLASKQTCFDDFISAAEYLVSTGYTQPKKLCIEGGSNGGLLIGACINQRPDLYGCALAHVGVMDMLRFHKFTIGHAWTSEYGSSENEEEFHWLIKYSPLHNVKRPWEKSPAQASQYPPTLLLTADHDDRVVPLHSLKFLATLQYVLCTSLEKSPQTNPIIARIDVKAGHGAGRPTKKMIEASADSYSFMAKMLGASWVE